MAGGDKMMVLSIDRVRVPDALVHKNVIGRSKNDECEDDEGQVALHNDDLNLGEPGGYLLGQSLDGEELGHVGLY